jgi:hypothetical protein
MAGAIEYARIGPGVGPDFPEGQYLRFVSGSGTLLSSDLLELTLARADTLDHQMANDLWLAVVLRDIPRVPLMRHDVTEITTFDAATRKALQERVANARSQGHYHFRVRSGRWEPEGQLQHDPTRIDTLVLNDILIELQASPFDPSMQLAGWQRTLQKLGDTAGNTVSPIGGPPATHD